jgi:hypothetical protein
MILSEIFELLGPAGVFGLLAAVQYLLFVFFRSLRRELTLTADAPERADWSDLTPDDRAWMRRQDELAGIVHLPRRGTRALKEHQELVGVAPDSVPGPGTTKATIKYYAEQGKPIREVRYDDVDAPEPMPKVSAPRYIPDVDGTPIRVRRFGERYEDDVPQRWFVAPGAGLEIYSEQVRKVSSLVRRMNDEQSDQKAERSTGGTS